MKLQGLSWGHAKDQGIADPSGRGIAAMREAAQQQKEVQKLEVGIQANFQKLRSISIFGETADIVYIVLRYIQSTYEVNKERKVGFTVCLPKYLW